MVQACPGVRLIGQYASAEALLASIPEAIPNVAIIDIRMPGMNGLELARALAEDGITVIFLTAFAEHGAEAFRVAAVDYVLKPASQDDIAQALERARRDRISREIVDLARGVPETGEVRRRPEMEEIKIRVTKGDVVADLRLSEIVHLRARNQYVEINTDAHSYVISGSLSQFLRRPGVERVLMRVHRSHAVQSTCVAEVRRRGGAIHLALRNGDRIPVSRSYHHVLDQLLDTRRD
jgi:DNA-binding LytR/AlgR family response regulator